MGKNHSDLIEEAGAMKGMRWNTEEDEMTQGEIIIITITGDGSDQSKGGEDVEKTINTYYSFLNGCCLFRNGNSRHMG
jgi:hypothetical protein